MEGVPLRDTRIFRRGGIFVKETRLYGSVYLQRNKKHSGSPQLVALLAL